MTQLSELLRELYPPERVVGMDVAASGDDWSVTVVEVAPDDLRELLWVIVPPAPPALTSSSHIRRALGRGAGYRRRG